MEYILYLLAFYKTVYQIRYVYHSSPGENRTLMPLPAFDLKSNVYTNFTTRPGCSRSADLVTKTWSPKPTRERSTTHQEKKTTESE